MSQTECCCGTKINFRCFPERIHHQSFYDFCSRRKIGKKFHVPSSLFRIKMHTTFLFTSFFSFWIQFFLFRWTFEILPEQFLTPWFKNVLKGCKSVLKKKLKSSSNWKKWNSCVFDVPSKKTLFDCSELLGSCAKQQTSKLFLCMCDGWTLQAVQIEETCHFFALKEIFHPGRRKKIVELAKSIARLSIQLSSAWLTARKLHRKKELFNKKKANT